jgi:hypothetical protein
VLRVEFETKECVRKGIGETAASMQGWSRGTHVRSNGKIDRKPGREGAASRELNTESVFVSAGTILYKAIRDPEGFWSCTAAM